MKKGPIGTLAQIAIIVILLPFIAVILGLFFSDIKSINKFLLTLIDNIPLFEVWVSLFSEFGSAISAGQVIESTLYIYIESFFEAFITGISVHIFNNIGKALKFSGLPILTTFVGVFVGCVILKMTSAMGNNLGIIAANLGVIVIMVVGIKFIFGSIFPSRGIFSLQKILMLIIEGLLAVIVCGYVTMLAIIANGYVTSVGDAAIKLTAITTLTVIALLVVYFLRGSEDYD